MSNINESKTLNRNWELVNFCEFDKYATRSYCAIHNVDESKNLGDITKVDETELDDFNMICGGSPCQDLSVAGLRKGLAGERSGLFMDQVRIVKPANKKSSTF